MRFGTVRVAIVSDAKLAQQMCVRMADNFSSRPSGLFVARVLKDKGPCYVLDNIIIEPIFLIDKDMSPSRVANLDKSIQSTGNIYVTQNNHINVCYLVWSLDQLNKVQGRRLTKPVSAICWHRLKTGNRKSYRMI